MSKSSPANYQDLKVANAMVDVYENRIEKLESENARLRELLSELLDRDLDWDMMGRKNSLEKLQDIRGKAQKALSGGEV